MLHELLHVHVHVVVHLTLRLHATLMRDVVESLTDERIAVAVVELVAPLGKHAVFTTFTCRLQHQ